MTRAVKEFEEADKRVEQLHTADVWKVLKRANALNKIATDVFSSIIA